MGKRIVKLLVSLVYLLARSPVAWFRGLNGTRDSSCIILYYHKVTRHEREQFARQMDLLARWTRPIRLDRPEDISGPGRWSAVSFDDAFQNVVENALPELRQRRIPATIFVPTGLLGETAAWLEGAGESDRVITEEVLLSLPPDFITIGSHTVTHPHLTRLSPEEARVELRDSKVRLEEILGRPVTLLAFPYGDYNEQVVSRSREAGYERVFTVNPTRAFLAPGEFVSGRVPADPGDWSLEFKLKVLGAYEWVPRAGMWKRRLMPRMGRFR